jgi:hypothetical protein
LNGQVKLVSNKDHKEDQLSHVDVEEYGQVRSASQLQKSTISYHFKYVSENGFSALSAIMCDFKPIVLGVLLFPPF